MERTRKHEAAKQRNKGVMMKIVVLDGFVLESAELGWQALEALGELTVYDRTPHDKVAERIGNAPYVYTNKTPITSDILAQCPELKFIGVLATGYNVVDIAEATCRGVTVCNVPSYSTDSVAQFTFALLLEICHHVGAHSDAVFNGEWMNSKDFCFWKSPLIELAGKTIGLVGFGRIGQAVAKIAKAMGLKVVYHAKTAKDIPGLRFVTLDELWKESDIVSLHCPLTEETNEMINKTSIAKMKDGVIIINTSRGGLIAEQDLAEALNSAKVYAAAADVVSAEPIKHDNPLLTAKNMILTPHIAWAPKEARVRLMEISVKNLEMFIKGTPINVVDA